MGSFIQIDSISIDLANSIDKKSATDAGKCEHFSIRGYVSEIRKKDWKMCWPFPLKESYSESENPASLLPTLDVPKFKWWCCRNCQEVVSAESIAKDGQTAVCKSDRNCSNETLPSNIQLDPMPDTVKRREIDLNNSIDDLSCGNSCEPTNDENEDKTEVAHSRLIDREIGLDDNLNHQTASVPPQVYPGLREEVSINESGCENKEVTDVTLVKACTVLSESTTVSEGGDTTDQTTGNPPLDSAGCHHNIPETTESFVETDLQDHQLDKATGLPRRRHRKVRLMTDLLRDNGEGRTEQMTMQVSPSNHSAYLQTMSIPQVKVDVPGDLTNVGQSRKRKCLLDDQEPKFTEICSHKVENVVKNFEGDAETIDSFLDTGSKDVHADIDLQGVVKSNWGKPEIERNHTMGKKKGKRTQVVDNYLTIESHQKQQKESTKTIDGVNNLVACKNHDSGSFTQKRTDNSPWQVPMTENECDLLKGKGKGKMPLTGRDLGSLSSLKNDMLAGEKVMLNMPASIPIHSAQCALNEKRLEEGLHLSLNSYLASQVYDKKMIHQIENQLHFSSPFQEGTSKVHQFLSGERETNVGELKISSKHRTDTISGKRLCSEEIVIGRNTEKTADTLKQAGDMKSYGDQTADKASEQGTLDDIPMEIVELMAKNQYERCLSDAENRNRLQEKSTVRRKMQMTVGTSLYGKREFRSLQGGQKEKPQGRNGKNGTVTTEENVKPNKRKAVHCVSSFDGNSLDMYGLCQPQSFGIEVSKSQKKISSGVHFSPIDSNLLVTAQNNKLNGNAAERGSSNSVARSQGGCSLHTTISREDDEASRIWSLNPNRVPLGYDIPRKVASQSTSDNNDVNSVRSGVLLKHNFRRDIDLNYSNLVPHDIEKLNRNIGLGSFNGVHSEYPFPCKNNGIESHQNLKGSMDLYSNDTIPAMHLLSLMDAGIQSSMPFKQDVSPQFLKRHSYIDDCNTKLEIGTSKAIGSGKRPSSAYCGKRYLSDKSHGCFLGAPTFGASTSSIQRNENFVRPADFTGQISSKSAKKEKIKNSDSPVLNRHSKSPKSMHTRGELIKDCDAVLVYGAQNRFPSVSDGKRFSWPCLETETSTQRKLEVRGTCGTFLPMRKGSPPIKCSTNKNPADLPMPEAGLYMIRGEDLKFEKASIPQMRLALLASHGRKQQRHLKRTKIKDHTKR